MFRKTNKVLIALLVLLVGIGPIGGVMAGSHTCAPNAGQGAMVADGMVHGHHERLTDTSDTYDASQSPQDCDGCDKDCCQGGVCKMGHCAGTAIVLDTSPMLAFEQFASSEAALTGDRPVAGMLTPPLRPPQA